MKKLLRAVAYLRRSTKGQEASIKDQRNAVQAYADKLGYQIVRWYIDDGISGDDTRKRHDFLKMIGDAQELGDFEAILCWDNTRFGRFDSIEAGYWIYPLREARVYLDTVLDGKTDWLQPTGRIIGGIKHEQSHDHNVKLSAGVLRGQISAAKTGSWIGSAAYGYRIEGEKGQKQLLLGTPAEVRTIERMFREFVKDGRSLGDIANRLNKDGIKTAKEQAWRYDAVRVILSNPVYVGTFRFNVSSRSKYHHCSNGECVAGSKAGRNDEADWIVIEDHHDAIVDKRTFSKAQAIIAKGKTGRSRYTPETNPYLLTGLLRCGQCGSILWGSQRKGQKTYECSRHNYRQDCKGTVVREAEVLDKLTEYIETEFMSHEDQQKLREKAKRGKLTEADLPDAFAKLRKLLVGTVKHQSNPKRIEKQIAKIDADVKKARANLVLLDADNIPAAQAKIRELEDERAKLTSEMKEQPTEQDINATVLDILRKLVVLAKQKRDDLQPVLRELESITCFTKVRGSGRASRHAFQRGEIGFKQVTGNTSNLNLHHRVQSPAACR